MKKVISFEEVNQRATAIDIGSEKSSYRQMGWQRRTLVLIPANIFLY